MAEDPDLPGFPDNEQDIIRLARKMIAGLRANPGTFPAPPHSADELEAMLNKLLTASEDEAVSLATLERARKAQDAAFEKLYRAAGGKGPLPVAAEVPGKVFLEATAGGLTWQPSTGNGAAALYLVVRRNPGGEWQSFLAVTGTAVRLDKPAQTEEYRVTAANRAGEGEPSNIVRLEPGRLDG